MNNKLFNTLIQILAIFFIAKYFIYDSTSKDKMNLILSPQLPLLVLFLFFIKILISYFFFLILNLILNKKINFLVVSETFLYGGMINQLLPGIGYVYRYYKLKFISNISLIEYSVSQTIHTLKYLFAYILFGLSAGIIYVSNVNLKLSLFLIVFIFAVTIIFFLFKKLSIKFIKIQILKIEKLKNFVNQLKKIKDNLKLNISKILLIFFGFMTLGLLECFAFYMALKLFGSEMTFVSSGYIWIISVLTRAAIVFNYVGIFELILMGVASLISPEINDFLVFSISFRIVDTIAIILAAFSCSLLLFFKKNKIDLN
tara:strand:+ start:2862 stop:3803 length:942 start_codon:yes stop_codon:yes gene_type:complete